VNAHPATTPRGRLEGPAALAVETTMFRGLGVVRLVLLAYALYWNVTGRWERYQAGRPSLAVVLLVLLAVWTLVTWWAYGAASRRTPVLLAADLTVALSTMLASPYLQGAHRVDATLPSFWVFGVMVAWAVRFHVTGGLLAAAVLTLGDLAVKLDPGAGYTLRDTTLQNVMLLWMGGGTIGYLTRLLQRTATGRDAAERRAAAVEERARLGRAVHDGTLQVLALVQRRGLELGGELAELGRLAGEQEASLRALIQADARAHAHAPDGTGVSDLVAELFTLQSPTVTVSGPQDPVALPRRVVAEVRAVVLECLANVERHVGQEAHAWLLVEDLGHSVVVSVRDDGPGIEPGRLAVARAEGRLGVHQSICGRLAALGGTARLTTAPGEGVEWELTVPREGS
jgi:signal transduction histidine kinase